MARPRRDGEAVAYVTVSVRLTEDEAAQLRAAASRAGFSQSDFIRSRCGVAPTGHNGPRQGGASASGTSADPALVDATRKVANEVNMIGNNLNQLARAANIAARTNGQMPAGWEAALDGFRLELEAVRSTAGQLIKGGDQPC